MDFYQRKLQLLVTMYKVNGDFTLHRLHYLLVYEIVHYTLIVPVMVLSKIPGFEDL